jgi:prepilin-type N-terminal cleavage/methylation domain-containing protein
MRPSVWKFNIKRKELKIGKNQGFSFIELIIALGILGIVLLPFLSFISYRLSKERDIDEYTHAIEIVKMEMEEALLLPELKDSEKIIENTYLVKIKVLDGDTYDEPKNVKPLEVRISIFRLKDNVRLFELCALK